MTPAEGGGLPDLAGAGWRWPAEWEPHRATWLAWPKNPETWPGGLLERVRGIYARMIEVLADAEPVAVLVDDEAAEEAARRELGRAGVGAEGERLRFHRIPTDDAWVRDTGPLVLVRGRVPDRERLALCPRFDAWGGKYLPCDRDAAVGRRIAGAAGLPAVAVELVLEGGSVDGNGRGTVLTTESCLLHPNRARSGPPRTRAALEEALFRLLGARRVVWLGAGIAGDDTDGHVDDLCRFVAPHTVVAAAPADASDPNAPALRENLRRLQGLRDAEGRPIEVVHLPMPRPLAGPEGPLPATYANFYLAAGVVLVPTFGVRADDRALAVLREVLAPREVVGIPARALVHGLGAVHCLTLHEPA